MKRILYLAFISLLITASCQSDSSKKSLEEMAADSAALADQNKTLVVPWEATLNDSTKMMEIKRNPAANMTNLSNLDIVDALNYKYPQIKLEWVKQEGNKAFVKIQDADYLTPGIRY
jgi:ABC-type enterochelin transport system substrate-binding protein